MNTLTFLAALACCVLLLGRNVAHAVPIAVYEVPVVATVDAANTNSLSPITLLDIEDANAAAVDSDGDSQARSARGLGLFGGNFGGGLGHKGFGGFGGLGLGGGLHGLGLGGLGGLGGGFGGFKSLFGKHFG